MWEELDPVDRPGLQLVSGGRAMTGICSTFYDAESLYKGLRHSYIFPACALDYVESKERGMMVGFHWRVVNIGFRRPRDKGQLLC